MASPLPEILKAWFQEGGEDGACVRDFIRLVEQMVRRQDYLPLELLAAKSGFMLVKRTNQPTMGRPSRAG